MLSNAQRYGTYQSKTEKLKMLGDCFKNVSYSGRYTLGLIGNWVQCRTRKGIFVTITLQQNGLMSLKYSREGEVYHSESDLTVRSVKRVLKELIWKF